MVKYRECCKLVGLSSSKAKHLHLIQEHFENVGVLGGVSGGRDECLGRAMYFAGCLLGGGHVL